ncbi:MAG TPA: stage II sporulation protein M [Anaeromyxobacteraceae bacterium]|nr:stage II sporulation protein M [Anaeromyxobacteraceae bacterium]
MSGAEGFESVASFVARRRVGWERLDELASRLGRARLSLAEVEELDRLTRRVAADLARARAAYPGSDAEGYLSELASRVHAGLHVRRAVTGTLRVLLRDEVPRVFRRNVRLFLLAAGLLAAGGMAGAFAVHFDPVGAGWLVPGAVREAVAEGRLWTDTLLTAAPGITGSLIARNNVAVVALAFALGLTGGLGTAAVLIGNGLLLGAVAAHCERHGMLRPLLGFVAAHGPAELAAVLLAAQAGFLLAAAVWAPGELSRQDALRERAREGGRLLVLVVPLLGGVALVESHVSPAATLSAGWKAALGLALVAALAIYLAWPGRRGGTA